MPKSSEIYNDEKAFFHLDRLARLREKKPIAPTCIQVDLEAFCNDNCGFCTTRKEDGFNIGMLKLIQINDNQIKRTEDKFKPIGIPNPNSGLPFEMAYRLPEMMKDAGIPAIELTGGGEPTLWRGFDTLIENLVRNNIEIGLVTNGSNISEERAKLLGASCTWIRFSMDTSNKTLHRKIHRTPGYDFERRIGNIKRIIKFRNRDLIIGVSFIIHPDNVHDIEKACKFYKKIGVDNIRFSWMYDKTGNAGLEEERIMTIKQTILKCKQKYEDENFAVLHKDSRIDLYSQPNDDFTTCYLQRFVWAIGADCKVYPCCIRKYVSGSEIGDIIKKTLKEIIYDENTINKMDSLKPLTCSPCWMRDKNKLIAKAVEKPPHVNFL